MEKSKANQLEMKKDPLHSKNADEVGNLDLDYNNRETGEQTGNGTY